MKNLYPFADRHAILPVIHVVDEDTAIEQAKLAHKLGCNGVFVICHTGEWARAVTAMLEIRKLGIWCGINLLHGERSVRSLIAESDQDFDALWTDYAPLKPFETKALVFSGCCFKYQRTILKHPGAIDFAQEAALVAEVCDVVTTSGESTGMPPSVNKVRQIQLGSAPLKKPVAVASGLDADNVSALLPHMNYLLVATSVMETPETFSESKLAKFVEVVRSWKDTPP